MICSYLSRSLISASGTQVLISRDGVLYRPSFSVWEFPCLKIRRSQDLLSLTRRAPYNGNTVFIYLRHAPSASVHYEFNSPRVIIHLYTCTYSYTTIKSYPLKNTHAHTHSHTRTNRKKRCMCDVLVKYKQYIKTFLEIPMNRWHGNHTVTGPWLNTKMSY